MNKKIIQFKKLSFFNFKCHKKCNFDFSNNRFILLTGANGAGKTSIIDAVAWVLYDETTAGVKGDKVVRKKSKKNCAVILQFSIDNDDYEVRKFRKHNTFKNDKIILKNKINITPKDVKDTTKLIENILMPKDIFFNCLLFSQFINKSFISLTHAGQKEILDQLLCYDKYNEYKKQTSDKILEHKNTLSSYNTELVSIKSSIDSNMELINDLKSNLIQIETDHNKDKNNIDDYIKNKTKEIDNKKNYIEILHKEIKTYEEELKYIKEREKELKIIHDNINIKKRELNNRVNSIPSLYPLLNKYLFRHMTKRYKYVAGFYSNKINKIEKINKSILDTLEIEFNEKTIELKNDIDKYKTLKNDIVDPLKNSLENDEYNIKKLLLEKEDVEDSLNSIKESNKCIKCSQNLPDNKLLLKFEKSLSEILIKETQLKESILSNKTELDKYKDIDDILNNLQIKYSNLDSEHYNNKTSINSESEIKILKLNSVFQNHASYFTKKKNDIKNFMSKINETHREKMMAETKTLHLKYMEEYNKCFNETTELNNNRELIRNKINIKNDIIEEYNNDIIEISRHEEKKVALKKSFKYHYNTVNNNIIKINKIVDSLNISKKEIDDKIEETNKQISILEFWLKAFGDTGIKSILLDEAIPLMNKKALELSALTNDIRVTFDSQRFTGGGDLRNKFSINAVNQTNLSDFTELSAGETRLANIIILLCLRHLMEEMASVKINILLMDEILDSLDPENSAIAVDIMKKLSIDYCVLLISHTHKDWIDADEKLML